MADVAAPAAPAIAPSTPSSGAPPGGGQAPAAKSTTGPRSTDGRFSPKDGAAGVASEGGGPPVPGGEAPPPKEPYRFKKPLKVFGQVEEVDLDEDGIARELQIARASRRQLTEVQKKLQESQELEKLLASNPEEFLRRRGVDLDGLAKKRIAELINLESMSDDQRASLQLQRERDDLAAKLKSHEDTAKAQRHQAQLQQLKGQFVKQYRDALGVAGVDLDNKAAVYEMTLEMAQVEKDLCFQQNADGQYVRVLELSPQQLASAALEKKDKSVSGYVEKLGARGFMKRHPGLYQAILQASVEDYERAHGAPSPTLAQPAQEPPVEGGGRPQYLSEKDVDARLRALTRAGR